MKQINIKISLKLISKAMAWQRLPLAHTHIKKHNVSNIYQNVVFNL